jgi:hypothetical protein
MLQLHADEWTAVGSPDSRYEVLSSFEPHRGGAPAIPHLVVGSQPQPQDGRQFVSNEHQRSTDTTNPPAAPPPTQSGASACLPTGLNECVTVDLGASRRRRTCPRTRATSRDLTRVADVPSGTEETGHPETTATRPSPESQQSPRRSPPRPPPDALTRSRNRHSRVHAPERSPRRPPVMIANACWACRDTAWPLCRAPQLGSFIDHLSEQPQWASTVWCASGWRSRSWACVPRWRR